MHKKLMMACMAIAAFAAFVIAPAAQASPVLTENGVAVAAGKKIIGTNTGNTKFEGAFNVECSTAHLTGTLTENTGAHIAGTIPVGSAVFTGTGTGGDCTSALGNVKVTVNSEICLTTIPKTDELTIDGCLVSSVTRPIEFTLEITGTGPCKYSVATIKGTYETNKTPTPVSLAKQVAKKSEGGFFCPNEGALTMTFDLYTDVESPLKDTEFPLTIS